MIFFSSSYHRGFCCEHHRSAFKTVAISVLHIMSLFFFVKNLLNAFLVLLPDIFSTLVTIPVAPTTTGMTQHFIFHSFWVSLQKFLYFNFVSVSSIAFQPKGIVTSINMQILLFLLLLIMTGLLARTSLSVPLDSTILLIVMSTYRLRHMWAPVLLLQCPVPYILKNVDVYRLSNVLLCTHFFNFSLKILVLMARSWAVTIILCVFPFMSGGGDCHCHHHNHHQIC